MKKEKMIISLLCSFFGFSFPALSNCIKVTSTSSLSAQAISAGYTASPWTGACDTCSGNLGLPSVVSLSSGSFQPSGTLLASSVASFINSASNKSYSPNQILFRCELNDSDSLYEMYATNGDSTYAGRNAASELDGAYFDVAKNVAVRMTNVATGEYYSRFWKARRLNADSWYSDEKYIYVPASAFSDVLYEMFKIDATNYYMNGASRYVDLMTQPRGYIAFKGPGLATNNLSPGQDSASNFPGFYDIWPAAWSTYKDVTYIRGALCEVLDYPSLVILPPISVGALRGGGSSQTPFNISLQCDAGAVSDTNNSTGSSANVAMGFLVNQASAVRQANNLGLVNSGGGLTWLLDTNYGSGGVASGVGIKIYDKTGTPINLLPEQGSKGSGNIRGWYAYKDLTSLVSSDYAEIYSGDFTASLEAISGQNVSSGTVNAQLQVVISFQ